MLRPTKFDAFALIFLGVVVTIGYTNYRSDMEIQAGRYAETVMHQLARHYSDSKPAKLPDNLPNDFTGTVIHGDKGYERDERIILADPFNKSKPQLIATGHDRDMTFRYKGAKLSYRRLNDKTAVVYSWGPDYDDDTKAIRDRNLVEWAKADRDADNVTRFIYDSTNGLRSNGDLLVLISLEDTISSSSM